MVENQKRLFNLLALDINVVLHYSFYGYGEEDQSCYSVPLSDNKMGDISEAVE